MKKNIFFALLALFIIACGGSPESSDPNAPKPKAKSMLAEEPADDGKGIGEFKNVELNDPLNVSMIANGKSVYEIKCAACHKLTDQRVVGPGWAGVTERRKPEWIMNMITNVDVMLAEDPEAQAQLKECLVRMPNQNLSTKDARDVLEFMYENDNK